MKESVMNIYMIVIATVSFILGITLKRIEFSFPILWSIYGIYVKTKKEKEIALGGGFSLIVLLLLFFIKDGK